MPVTPLLAAVAGIPDAVPGPVIAQIWKLAEGLGDADVMRTLAGRPESLPPEVVERLRLRTEAEVRIQYLSRTDLTDEERSTLLANEKRSDVFAGLIAAAKENGPLAARLAAQFASKPTKVLARQMLRDDFGNEALRFECLRVLAGDKRPPDWLWHKFRRVIEENAQNVTRTSLLADTLPVGLLLYMDMTFLEEASQLTVIDRLAGFASREYRPHEWESRQMRSKICRYLVEASALPGLSDAVVTALDALSTADWMDEGDRIAGALAGRRAMMDDSVDEHRLIARTASGSKLDDLVDLALVNAALGETLVQGLLENPLVWAHAKFQSLVSNAPFACIVKAMQTTRSHDLMSRLWAINERFIPEACWECVDEPQKLHERLVFETLACRDQPYQVQSMIAALLKRGVADDAISRLPFSVIADNVYYRRYSSSVLDAVVPQLVRLQTRSLGENPQFWENFNNLSADWSGTLGELLEASATL